ncbi:MAG: phosphoribosylamine--glycine ligase [Rhodoferax sp.]|nr:phosphoribosylamine--glycine ligase [Rhodoferax sp.]
MKVLVIGGGGREHALAWKLAQSPRVEMVFVAPGNGGTALGEGLTNLPITDLQALADWARAEKIGLTVVGPEAPLAAGAVDLFRAQGLRIFGPTRAAAQLESSKAFSKAFMVRHGIPTAGHATFSDRASAHAHVDAHGAPIVVKADGLAAGKGVVVALQAQEAHAAIDLMLPADAVAGGGARVVIEDYLEGEEASFIVVCDGTEALALATSQDHKRLLDGDLGPNTGGMGAYSPAPVVTPAVHARAMREVILPTLRGMEKDGIPYTGFLYAGLMVSPTGQIKTLEFNCRLGDPETQPILMRLKTDLLDVLLAATEPGATGALGAMTLQWDRRTALGVVMAAHGYPGTPRTGDAIQGLPVEQPDAMVFHAATAQRDGRLVTSGGRVLCVTVLADNVRQAQQRAYGIVHAVQFDGRQYRQDIGHRAAAH